MVPSHSAALVNHWVHSHEEDRGGVQVFRPASYVFPPARGRDAIRLEADGTLIKSIPGPDDRVSVQPAGSWKVQGKQLTLQHQDGAITNYLIESVDSDKLLLRPA